MSCLSWIILAVVLAILVGIGGFFLEAGCGLIIGIFSGIAQLFVWLYNKIRGK